MLTCKILYRPNYVRFYTIHVLTQNILKYAF